MGATILIAEDNPAVAHAIRRALERCGYTVMEARGEEAVKLLRRHEADLPMLFIVSQVSLETGGPEGVGVSVSRAEGEKCERCWRVLPELSRAPRVEGLCERCVAALPAGDGPSTRLGTGGREVA